MGPRTLVIVPVVAAVVTIRESHLQDTSLSQRRRRWIEPALWMLLAVLSSAGVFDHSLWGTNDTRGAGMIWDMYRHGTYVVTTINGEDLPEKPPLMHWIALLSCHLFGRVSEGLVRLPSALAGLGTLLLIHRWVARRDGEPNRGNARLAAWSAVFLCATALTFVEYSRVVMTDMTLTFTVTLSLWLFWRADEKPRAHVARWIPFLLAAAVAFFAKGMIGPVFIWCTVTIFLLRTRRPRLLAWLSAAFAVILTAVVLPWVAALYRHGGVEAVRFFFWDNQVGRFFHFSDPALAENPFRVHKAPFYYYFTELPLSLGALTFIVAGALFAWWRPGTAYRDRFATFLRSAMAGMFLILQASSAKNGVYALPVFPLLFTAAGIWLADIAGRRPLSLFERTMPALSFGLYGLCLLAVPTVSIALAVLRPELMGVEGGGSLPRLVVWSCVLTAAVVVTAVGLLRRLTRGERGLILPLVPAVCALFFLLEFWLLLPIMDRHRSILQFVRVATEQSRGRELSLATSDYDLIGAFTFYLDRRVPTLESTEHIRNYPAIHPGVMWPKSTPERVRVYLAGKQPRAVIAYRKKLPQLEASLSDVPHDVISSQDPGLRSRDFVILVNCVPAQAWAIVPPAAPPRSEPLPH